MPPGAHGPYPNAVTPGFFADRVLILDGRSQMDQVFREWLRAGGIEPKPAMLLGSPEAIRNVVAAGLGVSILSYEVVIGDIPIGGLAVRPFRPALMRKTAIIQRRDKPDDPALRIVRETIAKMLRHSGRPPPAPPRTGARTAYSS